MTSTRLEFDGQWTRAISGVLLGLALLVAVAAGEGRSLVLAGGLGPLTHAVAVVDCMQASRAPAQRRWSLP